LRGAKERGKVRKEISGAGEKSDCKCGLPRAQDGDTHGSGIQAKGFKDGRSRKFILHCNIVQNNVRPDEPGSLTKQTTGRVRGRTSTKQRSMTFVVRSSLHKCLGVWKKESSSGWWRRA